MFSVRARGRQDRAGDYGRTAAAGNRIKITVNGDRVTLELSPYDLTKGRITYRHK